MEKKTTPEIDKEVKDILSKSRKEIRRILIGYIERIKYLEGEEFYESIKKDIINSHKTPNK